MSAFSDLLYGLLQLIYPRLCVICKDSLQRSENELCLTCEMALPRYEWAEMDEHPMKQSLYGRVPVQLCWAMLNFRRNNVVQSILHAIKYHGNKELAIHMGKLMGAALIESGVDCPEDTVIIPVPLHERKKQKRGFNQSLLLAQGFSSVTSFPVLKNALIRKKDSGTQTKKNRLNRWENIKGSFALVDAEAITHKHIILIDDVFTTGATVEACWLEIQPYDPGSVSVCCLACTE